ncbi:Calcium-binding EGF domain [Seminavis robusta]|uniref:Calcium-binding EGF domain n=1 Tax=Seminavis robusta TaxID=568900 RepID=A0A9N8H1N7_9STRA|nr:Calcium-binding EGF domain [Seminavis robusta]|eukprot:Sro6_g004830.1 Calcium-binding EGF domain (736) ;mRNA; f:26215-28517
MNIEPPTVQRHRPLRSRRGVFSRTFLLLALALICQVDGQENATTDMDLEPLLEELEEEILGGSAVIVDRNDTGPTVPIPILPPEMETEAPSTVPATSAPTSAVALPVPSPTDMPTVLSTPAESTDSPTMGTVEPTGPAIVPTTPEPVTAEPTTTSPTFVPTNAAVTPGPTDTATTAPTTEVPVTSAPTTAVPETADPTSAATTVAPTTQVPATSAPTTPVPDTSAPTNAATTVSPVTQVPATPVPTTPAPTNTTTPAPTDPSTTAPSVSPSMMATTNVPTAAPSMVSETGSPTFNVTAGPGTPMPTSMETTASPTTKSSDGGPTSAPSMATPSPTTPAITGTLQNLEMTLEGLNQLMSPEAQIDWKVTTEDHVENYFSQNPGLDITNVVTTISDIEQTVITPSRWLRRLQTASVKVQYTQEISYQTQNADRDTPATIVTAPFENTQDQEAYLEALSESNNEFEDVTGVSPVTQGTGGGGGGGENPAVPPAEESGGLSTGALIGIVCGCVVGVLVILGVLYFVSQRGDDGGYVSTGKTPPSQLDVGGGLGDEVSTLAEPHTNNRPNGVSTAMSGESIQGYGDQSVATVDYDYSKAYGGGGDTSVSSAGGTFGSQTHTNAAGGATLGSTNGGPLDSGYAEAARGQNANVREELVDIYAPPGKLGVVIDTPDDGAPVVHAVKDSSVISDKLQVGDKLVAVDDEDVRSMTAIKVSKLISRKSANASRKLSIIRTVVIDE